MIARQRQRHRRDGLATRRSATSRRWTATSPSSAACTATCTCSSPTRPRRRAGLRRRGRLRARGRTSAPTNATLSAGVRVRNDQTAAQAVTVDTVVVRADGTVAARLSRAGQRRRGRRRTLLEATAAFPNPAPVERRRRSLPLHRLRGGSRWRRRHRRRVGAARPALLRRRPRAGLLAQRPVPGPARRQPPSGPAEHGLGDRRRRSTTRTSR